MHCIRSTVLSLPLLAAALLLPLAACGKDDREDPSGGAGIPESVWSATSLGPARQAAEVRKEGKDGEVVTVEGKIKDLVAGRAMLNLADLSLKSCADMGDDDHCKTPWDYCCEPLEARTAGVIGVEILGDDGKPLRSSLQGFHGLKHLDRLQVKGKVRRDGDGNVAILAERLHRP